MRLLFSCNPAALVYLQVAIPNKTLTMNSPFTDLVQTASDSFVLPLSGFELNNPFRTAGNNEDQDELQASAGGEWVNNRMNESWTEQSQDDIREVDIENWALPELRVEGYEDPNNSGNYLRQVEDRNKKLSANFTVGEFARIGEGDSKWDYYRVDQGLIDQLQRLRDFIAIPIIIIDGYYPPKYYLKKYGKVLPANNPHFSGRGAKIRISGMSGKEVAEQILIGCDPALSVAFGDTTAAMYINHPGPRLSSYMKDSKKREEALKDLSYIDRTNQAGVIEVMGHIEEKVPDALANLCMPGNDVRVIQSQLQDAKTVLTDSLTVLDKFLLGKTGTDQFAAYIKSLKNLPKLEEELLKISGSADTKALITSLKDNQAKLDLLGKMQLLKSSLGLIEDIAKLSSISDKKKKYEEFLGSNAGARIYLFLDYYEGLTKLSTDVATFALSIGAVLVTDTATKTKLLEQAIAIEKTAKVAGYFFEGIKIIRSTINIVIAISNGDYRAVSDNLITISKALLTIAAIAKYGSGIMAGVTLVYGWYKYVEYLFGMLHAIHVNAAVNSTVAAFNDLNKKFLIVTNEYLKANINYEKILRTLDGDDTKLAKFPDIQETAYEYYRSLHEKIYRFNKAVEALQYTGSGDGTWYSSFPPLSKRLLAGMTGASFQSISFTLSSQPAGALDFDFMYVNAVNDYYRFFYEGIINCYTDIKTILQERYDASLRGFRDEELFAPDEYLPSSDEDYGQDTFLPSTFDNQLSSATQTDEQLNNVYRQELGWDRYYAEINDILLATTGRSGMTLSGSLFTSAVAAWKIKNGFPLWNQRGTIDADTWNKMRENISITPVASPSCDLAVATCAFDISQKQAIYPVLLSPEKNKKAIAATTTWLKKAGVDPKHVLIDLERYVDTSLVKLAIDKYNLANPAAPIEPAAGPIDSILIETIYQFQRKIYFEKEIYKKKEIANPRIDGVAGPGTLHSLGIIFFKQSSVYTNPLAVKELKRMGTSVIINGKRCDHTNWFQFTYNPAFLAIHFKVSVHYLLLKQLRIAECHLLQAFKGENIVGLAAKLGLSNKTEKHAGGRPDGSGMHIYGLAIDIDHGGNPWVGAGWITGHPEGRHFMQTLRDAAKPAILPGGSTVFSYLDTIGVRLGNNTLTAFTELKQRNDEFIAHLGKPNPELSFWQTSLTFHNRNPKNGFLNFHPSLVVALRQVANLGWGAIDFGDSASGDIMHFDLRTIGVGRDINRNKRDADGKAAAGKDPVNTHPYLRNQTASKEMYEDEPGEDENQVISNNKSEEQYQPEQEFPEDPSLGNTVYLSLSAGGKLPAKTGVFIPTGFSSRTYINVIFFLHGHMGATDKTTRKWIPERGFVTGGIEYYWKNYADIRKYFAQAGRNAILIAPTLGDRSSEKFGAFGDKNGFDDFLNSCFYHLRKGKYIDQNAMPYRIILAAHSGGGNPLGKILNTQNTLVDNIDEVWGFDCIYGNIHSSWAGNYRAWAKTLPRSRSLYRTFYFYHYWAYTIHKTKSTPGVLADKLQAAFPTFIKNTDPVKYKQHSEIIESAWVNEINKRKWFDALVASSTPEVEETGVEQFNEEEELHSPDRELYNDQYENETVVDETEWDEAGIDETAIVENLIPVLPVTDMRTRLDEYFAKANYSYKLDTGVAVNCFSQFRMTHGIPIDAESAKTKVKGMLKKLGSKCPATAIMIHYAAYGRAKPSEVGLITQCLIDAKALDGIRAAHSGLSDTQLVRMLQFEFGIGIDCAGYVQQAFIYMAMHSDTVTRSQRVKLGLKEKIGSERLEDLPSRHFSKVDILEAHTGDMIVMNPRADDDGSMHTVLVVAHTQSGFVHNFIVDSSWGHLYGDDASGIARRTLVFNETTKSWWDISPVDGTRSYENPVGPYNGHPIKAVYRAKQSSSIKSKEAFSDDFTDEMDDYYVSHDFTENEKNKDGAGMVPDLEEEDYGMANN